jgi:hypothetical protein
MLPDIAFIGMCLALCCGWALLIKVHRLISQRERDLQRLTHKIMADGSVDWITAPVDRDRGTPP